MSAWTVPVSVCTDARASTRCRYFSPGAKQNLETVCSVPVVNAATEPARYSRHMRTNFSSKHLA